MHTHLREQNIQAHTPAIFAAAWRAAILRAGVGQLRVRVRENIESKGHIIYGIHMWHTNYMAYMAYIYYKAYILYGIHGIHILYGIHIWHTYGIPILYGIHIT